MHLNACLPFCLCHKHTISQIHYFHLQIIFHISLLLSKSSILLVFHFILISFQEVFFSIFFHFRLFTICRFRLFFLSLTTWSLWLICAMQKHGNHSTASFATLLGKNGNVFCGFNGCTLHLIWIVIFFTPYQMMLLPLNSDKHFTIKIEPIYLKYEWYILYQKSFTNKLCLNQRYGKIVKFKVHRD